MLDKRVVVFHGNDQPGVQVLREGDWHGGELRGWYQRDTGWDAMVQYRVGTEHDLRRAGAGRPGSARLTHPAASAEVVVASLAPPPDGGAARKICLRGFQGETWPTRSVDVAGPVASPVSDGASLGRTSPGRVVGGFPGADA